MLPIHSDVRTSPELRTPDSESLPGRSDHASGALGGSHSLDSSHIPPEGIPFSVPQYSIPQKPLVTQPPTIYTSCPKSRLDSAPLPPRSPGDGTVMHRRRKREHIYAKEVSLYSSGHQVALIGIPAQSSSAY